MKCAYLSLLISTLLYAGFSPATQAETPATAETLLAQGKYLSVAADCSACHDSPDHHVMAGGNSINSPLGKIVASNITPSVHYGIGSYTEQQFSDAVRKGINAQGENLYPAMPYTSYSQLTDSDIHALYYYFMHGVTAVDRAAGATQLPFPFNLRISMKLWNALYADNKPFRPSSSQTDQVNRGNYLIYGLAHCDTCHTPRNALMAEKSDQSLSGGSLGQWYAPNITSDKSSGIGNWSDQQLYQYLKTGHAVGKAQAAGPMAEAIEHSLQYLSDDDLHAIVASLRLTRPVNTASADRGMQGKAISDENSIRGTKVASGEPVSGPMSGAILYSGNCAACHTPSGAGSYSQNYPSLVHNTTVGSTDPTNLIATLLFGVHRTVDQQSITMPAFGPQGYTDRLSFAEIATLATYVRQTYGAGGEAVSEQQVEQVYQGGPKPLIGWLADGRIQALIVVVLLLLAGLIITVVRKGRKA
ncbi:cytochrome c [Tatumella citrea]|uniref:Cytochrome C n=1 Tax=Tatumella citrea TaxID=53336 RepID=A0A1Y0L6A6_TATCI|nr:cytochrome c [Tatumella citrea]ARU93584.1 cytochrome C [Tatumella citrea]ARU97622.1 cytochrome C [Tatumella citrea]